MSKETPRLGSWEIHFVNFLSCTLQYTFGKKLVKRDKGRRRKGGNNSSDQKTFPQKVFQNLFRLEKQFTIDYQTPFKPREIVSDGSLTITRLAGNRVYSWYGCWFLTNQHPHLIYFLLLPISLVMSLTEANIPEAK